MISDLVLGAMHFGTRTDESTAFALLDHFVEAGGTTVDTANCYAFWASDTGAGGQSEEVVGAWLRARPGVRERLCLSTKVGVEPATPGGFDQPEGLSAEVIARESARSLDRLGVDKIDLYWAHAPDPHTPVESVADSLGALVEQGLVCRLGMSNFATWEVERARSHAIRAGLTPITALQLSTSYVEQRPGAAVPGKDHRFGWVSEETRGYVERHPDIELWAYSPLIQGTFDRDDRPLPDPYDHPGTSRRLAALSEVAEQLAVARSTVVLAWLIARGIRPIIGVSSIEQLQSALAAGSLADDEQPMAQVMSQLDVPA